MNLPFQDQANPQGDIAVVGSGAIGRSLAGILSRAGHRVRLYGRTQSIRSIRESQEGGLSFKGPDDEDFACTSVRLKSYDEGRGAPYKTIFYTVKAGYLPSVMEQTRHLVDPAKSREIFIQGGVQWWFGHAVGKGLGEITDPQNIARLCAPARAISGMIKFGAHIPADKRAAVVLSGVKPVIFGQVDSGIEHLVPIQDLFVNTLVTTDTTQALASDLWAKAAGSFAMSAFALITGKPLGGMVSDPDVLGNMVECADLLRAAGRTMGFDDQTDYEAYFGEIATGKPNHMMSIVHDPSEHNAIIDMPIAITKALGFKTDTLEEIAGNSYAAAQRILRQQKARAPTNEHA